MNCHHKPVETTRFDSQCSKTNTTSGKTKHGFSQFLVSLTAAILTLGIGACSTGPAEGTSSPKVAAPDTVVIKEMAFSPDTLYIGSGDTVIFVNEDIVPHNVTDKANGSYASPTLDPGQSWKHAFTSDAYYYCSLHIIMEGHILVAEKD